MPGVVIVGGSIAGVRLAQSLRSEGYQGEIVVVTEESVPPYDKPPLSKALLANVVSAEDIQLITDDDAAGLKVKVLSGRKATGLDPARKVLRLDAGNQLAYDVLVIATGCAATMPSWGQLPGVHVLRTLSDGRELRESLQHSKRLAIIGAGFVGCEVAAIARTRGLDVWLVDPLPYPMARALDELTGEWFTRLHVGNGVAVTLGMGVTGLTGAAGDFQLRLTDGSRLEADAVLVAVGAQPNVAWLESSGLTLEDGVRCDEYGRAIGAEDVYAVGDVARWYVPSQGTTVRHEHWTNAVDQAQCVAHNIAHPTDLRTNVAAPYVWTDQYDWKAQMVGNTRAGERVVLDDPFGEGRAAALYADDDGALIGAVVVNWPRALVACRRAATSREPVDQVVSGLRAQRVRSRT